MVSLPDYRLPTDTNDNDALRKALATGQPVYLPAGQGSGPNQEYLIDSSPGTFANPTPGNLTDGAVIYGDGIGRTIVRQTRDYIFLANSLSADPAANRRGITIKSMTLMGYNPGTFDEFSYLILLAGVTNALIEQVEFRGFSGDGLFLGSPQPDLERHNVGVTVRSCSFVGGRDANGVNQNRNGISIVECVDWLIDGCSFTYCSRGDQPGPIDVEPEKPFQYVARGKVTGCYFEYNGGFALNLSLRADTQPQAATSDIRFEYSSVRNSTGAFGWSNGNNSLDAGATPYNVNVNHLYVVNTAVPFRLLRAHGLAWSANEIYDSGTADILSGGTTRAVSMTANAFVRCGKDIGPVVMDDGGLRDVSISNNHFIDCGRIGGGFGPIYFLRGSGSTATDKIDGLKINNNRVDVQTSPARTTQIALLGGDWAGTIVNSEKIGNSPSGFTPADNLL